ncbi:MAG: hypothetical protein MZU97_01395 [Bacillus subtilis]|nr:hypothetical protein [Bacillus subtilis]
MAAYFGTDGIRGEAHVVLTEELAFRLGQSLAALPAGTVVDRHATRANPAPCLSRGVERGARKHGHRRDATSASSRPRCSSWVSQRSSAIGVMITASHNPYTRQRTQSLRFRHASSSGRTKPCWRHILQGTTALPQSSGEGVRLQGIDPWRYVLADCSCASCAKPICGSAWISPTARRSATAPRSSRRSPRISVMIGIQPNGTNINEGVGSTHIEALRKPRSRGTTAIRAFPSTATATASSPWTRTAP